MGIWSGNPNQTIGVDLWGHQARGKSVNTMTLVGRDKRPKRRELRELYIAAYRAFAELCRSADEPGLAVVAVHETTGKPQGIVRLRARVDRFVAAIVGRHDATDLFLNASDSLALRHLAVVVDPVKSWRANDATIRYRVLDLRTGDGFADEHGRALRGLCCEGPAMLRCGEHALFLLPLGDPSDWPVSPDDAWAMLPERVYFDELLRAPDGTNAHKLEQSEQGAAIPVAIPAQMREMPGMRRTSTMIRTHGPRDSGVCLAQSGVIGGTIDLIGPNLAGQISIGERELRDGVLLGRYARCDSAQFCDDPSLSRVHALLIQIDGRVVIVDTASVNGTRLIGEHRQRLIELVGDTDLQLGKHTRARWRAA